MQSLNETHAKHRLCASDVKSSSARFSVSLNRSIRCIRRQSFILAVVLIANAGLTALAMNQATIQQVERGHPIKCDQRGWCQ
jgi:hypothetical protein